MGSDDDDLKLNKAIRLELSGLLAADVRGMPGARRRVKTYDQFDPEVKAKSIGETPVVRVATDYDLRSGVLKSQKLEIEMQDGLRPKSAICVGCEKVFEPRSDVGPLETICSECRSRKCSGCYGAFSKSIAARAASKGRKLDDVTCESCRLKRAGIDITGQIFHRLTVVRRAGSRNRNYMWECICSCENKTVTVVSVTNLRRGYVKSCGCLNREATRARHAANRAKKQGEAK